MVDIKVRPELEERIELVAALTNTKVNDVINQALSDWLDTKGDLVIEAITGEPDGGANEHIINFISVPNMHNQSGLFAVQ